MLNIYLLLSYWGPDFVSLSFYMIEFSDSYKNIDEGNGASLFGFCYERDERILTVNIIFFIRLEFNL